MTISESAQFTKDALKLIGEESLFELKVSLVHNPKAGDVIPGQNGLRKIRWAASGHGKRGGARVIYFYIINKQINLLSIYSKNKKSDLTQAEYKNLRDQI